MERQGVVKVFPLSTPKIATEATRTAIRLAHVPAPPDRDSGDASLGTGIVMALGAAPRAAGKSKPTIARGIIKRGWIPAALPAGCSDARGPSRGKRR